jgi:hypothetical protein
LKIDVEEISLCASLDSRNDPGRLSAKEMPGFLVGVVLRAGHGRIQAHGRHAAHYFFGEDVPDVLGNYVGRHEIKRILLVGVVLGPDGALVATVLFADCRLHLHPEDSGALVVHEEVVS